MQVIVIPISYFHFTWLYLGNGYIMNKEKKIIVEVKKQLENSGLNNELQSYYLDEKRLLKAVKDFTKGVKKADGNVFWQKDDNQRRPPDGGERESA